MLAKWNPFANSGIARSSSALPGFDDLFTEADRLFESAFAYPYASALAGAPAADIVETADELLLTLDLPGFDPKAMEVKIEGDLLTVSAQRSEATHEKWRWLRKERAQLQVARSFVLPPGVDTSRCEAHYEHGVLTLTLPRREEAKPKSISVKVKS